MLSTRQMGDMYNAKSYKDFFDFIDPYTSVQVESNL